MEKSTVYGTALACKIYYYYKLCLSPKPKLMRVFHGTICDGMCFLLVDGVQLCNMCTVSQHNPLHGYLEVRFTGSTCQ